MISEEYVDCRRFILCVGHMDSGDSFVHKNVGPGVANNALWVSSGGGTVNGSPVGVGLYDLSVHAGAEIVYVSGDSGVNWVAFNSLKNTSGLKVQFLSSGSNQLSPDTACSVVSVAGQISVNNTIVPEFKYARLFPGKTYLVEVPDGACAAVVTV